VLVGLHMLGGDAVAGTFVSLLGDGTAVTGTV
jgi:hypothetical protein